MHEGVNWSSMLEEISFSINIEKQSTTNYTPFYLLFGRNPKIPQEMINNEQYEINIDINKDVKCDIINRRSTEDKVLERVKGIQKKTKGTI